MQITEYSTKFATKLNFVLDNRGAAQLQKGRIKAICDISQEPDSSVNGWLFTGKMPREKKRLAIADRIGVSYDYLFDDAFPIASIMKPELHVDENTCSVPYIHPSEIINFRESNIYPITERVNLSFQKILDAIPKYGKKIYVTKLKSSDLIIFFTKEVSVIYTENSSISDGDLVLQTNITTQVPTIRKILLGNSNEIYLLNSSQEKQLLSKSDILFPVIFTYW